MKKSKVIIALILMILLVNSFSVFANDDDFEEVYNSDLEKKVVYLTLDDGPTIICNRFLDKLKELDVKATFFVVGKEIVGRENILKRMYDEGHAIGLHTYSHNFKYIYSSRDNFISEMKKTQKQIVDILGPEAKSNIIRFPGGSAGLLNKDFIQAIHDNGFKIYDWNVNLEDGVDTTLSVSRLLENSKKQKGEYEGKIILGHCNSKNKNTLEALEHIVEYYKENGYEFKVIDENVQEYYYKNKPRKVL